MSSHRHLTGPSPGTDSPGAVHPGHGGHASQHQHPAPEEHSDLGHGGQGGHGQHGGHGRHAGHDKHGGRDGHAGHDKHAGHDPEAFRRRFWLSLALTVPVAATSHMVMGWLGYDLDLPGVDLVAPVLGTVVYVWGGWPFLQGAGREVRARQPGMMLLVALAITVAFGASAATSVGLAELDFWWELSALVTVMLLGHWQEMKAIGQARGALAALAELLPDEAEQVGADGTVTVVAASRLSAGDLVLVRPGGRVPADGVVESGAAEVDESMVTGESQPVLRGPGDRVVAGTVVTDSAVRVRVDRVGDETALAGIQRLVAEAQASRSRAQVLADRFAGALFYVAVGAAALTLSVTWAADDLATGVVRAVTVLVIACPHALGLAIPLVLSISTGMAARHGILVKDRLALERMRTVDAVLFDKTGTLTRGSHVVTSVASTAGYDGDEVLRLAASVEADSEHPLARAVVRAAARRHLDVPAASSFRAMTGRGVEGQVDGRQVAVGGPALLRERSLDVPAGLRPATESAAGRGAAVLHVAVDGLVVGAVVLEDQVRPEAHQAVASLRRLGVSHIALVTGDARAVADAVGAEVGVDEVLAEVLPEDKEEVVAQLERRGLSVAMVGDGVNDAPALARASVGLAIGAGTDVAIESAGVVLASDDPRAVAAVVRLSRASYRKMLQNLAWAAGYNVVAIPLAGGALAWAGLTLAPAVGAVLMSLSTVVVAVNAQLLRRLVLAADG